MKFFALPRLPLIAVCTLPLLAMTCDENAVMVRGVQLSPAALNDYQGAYAQDKEQKAFAVSPDGAFGIAHSFPTVDLAKATALLECNKRVRLGQGECFLYDVNGAVVAAPPFSVKIR